jgi:hypothetical protein
MYEEWYHTLQAICDPPSPPSDSQPFHLVRSVSVKVTEAKDLPKTGDYYVQLRLDDEIQARTQTKTGTTAPFWHETFEFDDIPVQTGSIVLEIMRTTGAFTQVARQQAAMLKRRIGHLRDSPRRTRGSSGSAEALGERPGGHKSNRDMLISQVTVRLADLDGGSGKPGGKNRFDKWLRLAAVASVTDLSTGLPAGTAAAAGFVGGSSFDGSGGAIVSAGGSHGADEVGSLRLEVALTDEHVRPTAVYQPLADAFEVGSPMLVELVQALDVRIGTQDRLALARTLMAVAHARGDLLRMLQRLCEAEVAITADPHTLFRGNSLASKAVDEFMKQSCIYQGSFLEMALGMPVQSIYEHKTMCEVDPTRLGDSAAKDLPGNTKRLMQTTTLVWNSLMHALDHVPPALRFIFANLHAIVAHRFPDSPKAPSTAVVGFFFLRLICPALLGPQLFGLQGHQPEEATGRTLTLVSKVGRWRGDMDVRLEKLFMLLSFFSPRPFPLRRLFKIWPTASISGRRKAI